MFAVGGGAVFLIGAAGAGVAFATTRPPAALTPGTARLVPGDSAVTVHRGSPTSAADAPLRSGDALTVERGVAIVQTSTGTISARPGTTITFDDASPRITHGDALIQGHAMAIAAAAADVVVDGVTRLHQGLSLDVGVYRGVATVKTIADSVTVSALRRAVVAGLGGAATTSQSPLPLDPTDTWDRSLMGDALELDAALNARSRGLTMQVANAPGAVRERVLAIAASGWSDLSPLSTDEPVGEVVVAAELAKAAKLPGTAVNDALHARADGASWGLIAIAHGVRSVPARLAAIDDDVVPAVAAVVKVSAIPVIPVQSSPADAPATPTNSKAVIPPALPELPTGDPVTPPVTDGPLLPDNPVQGLVDAVGGVLHGLLG